MTHSTEMRATRISGSLRRLLLLTLCSLSSCHHTMHILSVFHTIDRSIRQWWQQIYYIQTNLLYLICQYSHESFLHMNQLPCHNHAWFFGFSSPPSCIHIHTYVRFSCGDRQYSASLPACSRTEKGLSKKNEKESCAGGSTLCSTDPGSWNLGLAGDISWLQMLVLHTGAFLSPSSLYSVMSLNPFLWHALRSSSGLTSSASILHLSAVHCPHSCAVSAQNRRYQEGAVKIRSSVVSLLGAS